MYWWINFFVAIFLFACTSAPQHTKQEQKEFDLPAYFQREIKRLSAVDKAVVKTVSKGDVSETKTLRVDWKKELAAFASIDINKPVYAGYIYKDSSGRTVTFRIDNPKLDISMVRIQYNEQNEPLEITIQRKIDNLLYDTAEKLHYKKNESYRIEKQQDVWVLGTNHYTIAGSLN
ncbi:hypothetical protein G5B30_07480 [Sphingobacterium sp. SGG-5]|uniref:hypothetical protein n=1 Tax=Sphingobacterium sp. SGG-5 TaxID=2710881 RepID=UPI0013EB0ACE|nr:hypothetical protein [Sphingobacterium sp. SGG-5]NGM61753.1 hypothetical protein [Sphingobacterium sp. SGG-5]